MEQRASESVSNESSTGSLPSRTAPACSVLCGADDVVLMTAGTVTMAYIEESTGKAEWYRVVHDDDDEVGGAATSRLAMDLCTFRSLVP